MRPHGMPPDSPRERATAGPSVDEERFDVVVVGAGQAGLAMGYHLQRLGLRFVVLERNAEVGASWRQRWDSLRLFTPARYDALPGLPFPLAPESYPGKDDVADYLRRYAEVFDIPVRTNTAVTRLEPEGAGFRLQTDGPAVHAHQVVVATGPFQRPAVPPFAAGLDDAVTQLHSAEYRGPEALPDGEVLVVGGGNSGVQIAVELAVTRRVHLSRSRPLPTVPARVLGRSLFWWLETLGLTRVPADSALGRRMRRHDDVVIGTRTRDLVRAGAVVPRPRAVSARGDRVAFADGSHLPVRTVMWATGYRPDFSWVRAPVLDPRGEPVHRRGVTAVPGLYFLGLRWQHTTGSALLGWVDRDAAFLVQEIARRSAGRTD